VLLRAVTTTHLYERQTKHIARQVEGDLCHLLLELAILVLLMIGIDLPVPLQEIAFSESVLGHTAVTDHQML
jgi:hypothetical protein